MLPLKNALNGEISVDYTPIYLAIFIRLITNYRGPLTYYACSFKHLYSEMPRSYEEARELRVIDTEPDLRVSA